MKRINKKWIVLIAIILVAGIFLALALGSNTELKEKYQEAILSMIKAGISDEMIMKYMGCTFESLNTLKKEMNEKEG